MKIKFQPHLEWNFQVIHAWNSEDKNVLEIDTAGMMLNSFTCDFEDPIKESPIVHIEPWFSPEFLS